MRSILRGALTGAALTLALVVPAAGTSHAQALNDQDRAWLAAAHQSNLAEIAAGTAAQQQATTDTVKNLGAMFVQMHTQLDADLTAVAQQLGVTLPTAPTPEQQQSLAAVQAQQGPAFDAAWITQQIASHQATLAATQQQLAQGSDPTVIALAQASTPVVEQHLRELQAAQVEIGGTAAAGGPNPSANQPADLPATGAASEWIAAVAATLLTAGAVLVGLSRRRSFRNA
jgi:putative membrane protein